jgi:S-adenosylmethionine synthetase
VFRKGRVFSSESVSEGHPDKVCDFISDAVLDAYLAQDKDSRVACEVLATTDRVIVAGEVRGPGWLHKEIETLVRQCVKEIGYEQLGFHWQTLEVQNLLHEQSKDIARGVDAGNKRLVGAGDQGIMFGYAVNETSVYMPAPIYYAHKIMKTLADARKSGAILGLAPDAKSQVTLRYENGSPVGVACIVVSNQHIDPALSSRNFSDLVRPVIEKIFPDGWISDNTEWYMNPTGAFVIGGPHGDTGMTGRKIIVDTYGGAAPHGGGAFSGKDCTKVDRSAAYAARYLAKNIVAAGLARRCCIQIAYSIGVAQPLALFIDMYGTNIVDGSHIEKVIFNMMDLSPSGICRYFGLDRPIFKPTAAYGHFGRDPDESGSFSWERLDLVESLQSEFGISALAS